MNHLKTFLLTIDDDAFQLEDDSFLLLGSAPCLNYYHVYELLSSFNRVIIPFRDPVNRSMILFAPILVLFTPTLAPIKRLCRKSVYGSTGSPRTDHGTLKINYLTVRPECI